MPTYQYECAGCSYTFEAFQSIRDQKLKQCPKCKKLKLHRIIGTGSGIVFKGSGFYETDYKKKNTCPVKDAGEKPCSASCCAAKNGSPRT